MGFWIWKDHPASRIRHQLSVIGQTRKIISRRALRSGGGIQSLLDQQHLLGLGKTFGFETIEIHPARQARRVKTNPVRALYEMPPDHRPHALPQQVVDRQRHSAGPGHAEGEGGRGVERVGIVLGEGEVGRDAAFVFGSGRHYFDGALGCEVFALERGRDSIATGSAASSWSR